jgi:FkbM family methyltransferase
MKQLITHLYETGVRLLTALPHKPIAPTREMAANRRGTAHVIKLLHDLNITPRTLVDVGANNSQWARWIKQEYPGLAVISFEPLGCFHPIGEVIRMALGDRAGFADMKIQRGASHITRHYTAVRGSSSSPAIRIERFDQLNPALKFNRPAVLKLDCENYTAAALRGFGRRLADFDLIVVEMWNDYPTSEVPQFSNQQADIWRIMLDHGFRMARAVDAEYSTRTIPTYDLAFWRPSTNPVHW